MLLNIDNNIISHSAEIASMKRFSFETGPLKFKDLTRSASFFLEIKFVRFDIPNCMALLVNIAIVFNQVLKFIRIPDTNLDL